MKLLQLCFLALLSLLAVSSAEEFDFFYFVQQWPGSFCNTRRGCCFPDSGKPAAEFGIHGLWPNYSECRRRDDDPFDIVGWRRKCWPEYCNDDSPLNPWEIKDLVPQLERAWPTLACKSGRSMEFWSQEWNRHGTCSDLDQHAYFQAALALKARHNLAKILAQAGIVPSEDETYSVSSIRDAISEATGYRVSIECNRDAFGEAQLYQVYQCVDRSGKTLIDCELPMRGHCRDMVKLPTF